MNDADRKDQIFHLHRLLYLHHRAMALQGHPTDVQEDCLVDWIVYNMHAQELETASQVLIDANLPGAYALLRMRMAEKGV